MEKDREDNFLYEKSLADIQAEIDSGEIPGDYVKWSGKEKKFVPFEWNLEVNGKKIHNTMAPACFYCHSAKALSNIGTAAKGTLMFRMTLTGKLTGKNYFAATDTVGGLLGTVNATGVVNYDSALFDNETGNFVGSNIVGKSDYACAHCHGVFQFDDFDNDGKVTGLDFVKVAKDPMYAHPDAMKEAMVWQFNATSKNYDVHKLNNVGCADCHAPVNHEYIGSGYYPGSSVLTPSHDFAKGNAGPAFGVMWTQLAGSASCTNCHSDYKSIHDGVFGPSSVTDVHMEKVACTTCHIGKKYFYRVKFIDWTLPMWVVNGNADNIQFAGLDKHGYLYGDPVNGKYEDIALLPERDFKTGKVVWKYKPVNAMGVLLFEDNSSGEFKPVFARYLAKAFKLDPNLPTKYLIVELDPSTGKPKRVPGAVDPQTGQPIMILNIKGKKGKIAEDTELQSGNWGLWRAVPNYIDVDLDGKYTEGVDVQIKDDTGLKGTPDGDPEINTKEEVEAAIATLKKIISSATGKSDVEVKIVATADAFGMSHNIRHKEEALKCADCHGGRGETALTGPLFSQKTPLYFEYDPEVENATYFEKKVDRAPDELTFAEDIKEEMVAAGYPESGETTVEEVSVVETSEIELENITDTSAVIKVYLESGKKVDISTNIIEGNATIVNVETQKEILKQIASKLKVSKIYSALEVKASSKFTVKFDITGLDLSKLTVKTDKGSVVNTEISGNSLIATIDPTRGDDTVTVALVEEPSESESTNNGGDDDSGCSISPAAGVGGGLSYLLTLLPLGFLRFRRKN